MADPLPATPTERESAIYAAFDGDPVKVVSMRAGRYLCPWPACKSPAGEACTSPRSGGRRRFLTFPHGARIALTMACPEHGTRIGERCPDEKYGVCKAREQLVAPLVALNPALARSTAGDAAVDRSTWPDELVLEDEHGMYAVSGEPVEPEGGQAVRS